MKPAEIPWGDAGALYVVESTGVFLSIEKASVSLHLCTIWNVHIYSIKCYYNTEIFYNSFPIGSHPGWRQARGCVRPITWCPHVCDGSQPGQVWPIQYDHCQVSKPSTMHVSMQMKYLIHACLSYWPHFCFGATLANNRSNKCVFLLKTSQQCILHH